MQVTQNKSFLCLENKGDKRQCLTSLMTSLQEPAATQLQASLHLQLDQALALAPHERHCCVHHPAGHQTLGISKQSLGVLIAQTDSTDKASSLEHS